MKRRLKLLDRRGEVRQALASPYDDGDVLVELSREAPTVTIEPVISL